MSRTREEIVNALSQPLEVHRIGKRPGAGNKQLSYLESYDVINHLNIIFGFDGWMDRVLCLEPVNENVWRATVAVEARIGDRWVTHSDTGIGVTRSQKAEEIEKAVKEAVSDALKRAARKFGDQFGNCLYEKDAPEHVGQQRAAIATVAELEAYGAARKEAVELGFKTPKGNDPKVLETGVSQAECLKRTDALRQWIAAQEEEAGTEEFEAAQREEDREAVPA